MSKDRDEVVKKHVQVNERIDKLKKWLTENERDGRLDKELINFSNHAEEIAALNLAIDGVSADTKKTERQKIKDEQLLAQNDKSCIQLKKLIEQLGELNKIAKEKLETAFSGKTLDELETEVAQLPTLINICEQQLKLAKTIIETRADVEKQQNQNQLNKQLHIDENGKLIQLIQEKNTANEKLNSLQDLYDLEIKIQKYDDARQDLQPEEPCPLCGSSHHPYVEGGYVGHVNEAEQRRNDQRQVLKKITGYVDAKSLVVNTLTNKLDSGAEQLQQFQAVLETAVADFKSNNMLLPKALEIEKANVINAGDNKEERTALST